MSWSEMRRKGGGAWGASRHVCEAARGPDSASADMVSGRPRRLVRLVANFEGFLDRGQRCFRRIHNLFRVVGHIGRRLAIYAGLGRRKPALKAGSEPRHERVIVQILPTQGSPALQIVLP